MPPLSAAAFESAWGRDHLVRLSGSGAALPDDAARWLTTVGLPRLVHIGSGEVTAETTDEITFAPLARPLLRVTEPDEEAGRPEIEEPYPAVWREHWAIGRHTFDNGEIDLCVHQTSGHVVGLDIELESLVLYDTSVPRLASVLALAAEWSKAPRAPEDLLSRIREVDPEAMESDEFFWNTIANGLDDDDPIGIRLVRRGETPIVWRWKGMQR
jgi:hypothetical protein